MHITELKQAIQNSGGVGALECADVLLEKVNRLESTGRYSQLVAQLRNAREQGDLRGRVLEINFANQAMLAGRELSYGATQGTPGDIDFCWNVNNLQVFLEMKLLRQDQARRDSESAQLAINCTYASIVADDTHDIRRIQLDLIAKATTRKFRAQPDPKWINLVAIDVAELQLGMADMGDCLLATAGNAELSARGDHGLHQRPGVVGMFERVVGPGYTTPEAKWITTAHKLAAGAPHPRDYIHGTLFLFREPKDTAALCYELTGAVVWNRSLISKALAISVGDSISQFLAHPPR